MTLGENILSPLQRKKETEAFLTEVKKVVQSTQSKWLSWGPAGPECLLESLGATEGDQGEIPEGPGRRCTLSPTPAQRVAAAGWHQEVCAGLWGCFPTAKSPGWPWESAHTRLKVPLSGIRQLHGP